VRPNGVAFGSDLFKDFTGIEAGPHNELVRQWSATGVAPATGDRQRDAIEDLGADEMLARLHFRVAVHARRAGADETARRHFDLAGRLAPNDFTIRRATLPLVGEDPFGEQFFAIYEEWEAAGCRTTASGRHLVASSLLADADDRSRQADRSGRAVELRVSRTRRRAVTRDDPVAAPGQAGRHPTIGRFRRSRRGTVEVRFPNAKMPPSARRTNTRDPSAVLAHSRRSAVVEVHAAGGTVEEGVTEREDPARRTRPASNRDRDGVLAIPTIGW